MRNFFHDTPSNCIDLQPNNEIAISEKGALAVYPSYEKDFEGFVCLIDEISGFEVSLFLGEIYLKNSSLDVLFYNINNTEPVSVNDLNEINIGSYKDGDVIFVHALRGNSKYREVFQIEYHIDYLLFMRLSFSD